ncbi:Por secretion system C-terminal sorting domain-containing protein, partial [Paenimyroides aquimaris]
TKLKKLVLPSNWLLTIDFSANKDLEYVNLGNHLEFMQYNDMTELDLSNNNNLKKINVYNLITLERLNMRNNTADSVTILLGHNSLNNVPYNVCIEVDDYVAATNGTAPYDKWAIYNAYKHFFSDNCVLSVEKFVNENFKIYPNPAANYVTIEQKETNGVTLQAVQILDSSGKWVRSVKDHFNHIDVSALSKGMYLFVIQTDKGNKTEKILIK